jgi:predicted Zn-dependent protease
MELLQNMFFSMGARQADEKRSFLAKTKIGDKLLDERVSIYSDYLNEEVPASAWNQEGLPQEKRYWIEKGVLKNMMYSRFWAKQKNVNPVPMPSNFIMEGTNTTTEELIKNTKKGILVTRLWYIRPVDPQTLLYTGLTRDGTFYIENGKIKYPIKNFRFNESVVIMLNNIEALGKQQRINGNLIPTMKVRDFTFTSLSEAV